jgi:glucose-1-phosphate thymidylyltransferase
LFAKENVISANPNQIPQRIGLLPAGGKATRLGALPCSKEIFPIGFTKAGPEGKMQPFVAATGLLESMHLAGAKLSYFILRNGKWDIPAYYGHGGQLKMHLAYLIMDQPYGAPYTLDQAYPFIQNATILFGFPDILFHPKDAFVRLLERQSETETDIVLGGFQAENPSKMDMLVVDGQGRVKDIVIKPAKTTLTHTWILAVWTARFSRYLHDYVANDRRSRSKSNVNSNDTEVFVGDVIRAAIKESWTVETVFFDHGAYVDVGTPEDMINAMSDLSRTFGGKE